RVVDDARRDRQRPAVPTDSQRTDQRTLKMTHRLTWLDRLRIERVVWALDQRLYDVPRNSRIAHRREVRQNLLSAAQDVGTTAALRNIGTSAQLAAAYVAAEFGDRPR